MAELQDEGHHRDCGARPHFCHLPDHLLLWRQLLQVSARAGGLTFTAFLGHHKLRSAVREPFQHHQSAMDHQTLHVPRIIYLFICTPYWASVLGVHSMMPLLAHSALGLNVSCTIEMNMEGHFWLRLSGCPW